MSDPKKELKNIESMMFGGFIEPTPKNGIAWRVFEAVMGLRKERDQWRECAERLVEAFRGVPYDPFTVGSFNAQNCKNALADFKKLKDSGK